LPAGDALDALIRTSRGAGAENLLLKKISPTSNPNLADLLPEGRNVLVVPFSLEQATGLLMIEYPSRWGGRPARVERRVIGTAQQAATHASTALGRAILTERIRAAATTDGLTKVANRRTFDESLAKAISAANTRAVPFALVLIDLDHFKKLNDRHGHLVGDDVLRGVAAALRTTCREGDLAARYGGEEFAAILSPAGPEDAMVVAERIRLAISDAETPVPVTASLGVALGPLHGSDPTTIIGAADAALYVSKEAGRNRVSMAHVDGRVPQAA
jgi:diguanylate cyclase (GGDEF)-like protein